MWSLRRSGSSSIMSSSDYDSSQGSILVSSETSTGPSRLDSFSSGGNEGVPCNDFNMQTSLDFDDNPSAIPASPISSASSHDRQGGVAPHGVEFTSATNSTTDQSSADNTDIVELESMEAKRAVSPTIQKWVDESCVETERLKYAGQFSDDAAIKDEEIDAEEVTPSTNFALQQALELSLRAVSPSYARTASLDASFSALGDYQSQLTPTENMLLGLGFGGPDLGIPVRFLKSWRDQVIKRKIMELQGLLGRSRKSPSPTGSARQYGVKSPKGGESTRKKAATREVMSSLDKKATQNLSQQVPSSKAVVKPSEKQLQLEKLKEMRQKLRKSATFSSFSPSLLPDPSHLTSGKDLKKKGPMSEKKHQKFRGATRGNAKDRRRKFGTRQSSLPISLETLPEEDEGRPAFLQQKSNSFDVVDNVISSNNTSTATSVNSSKLDLNCDGTEDCVDQGKHLMDVCHKSRPVIVMSQPSDDPDPRLFVPDKKHNPEKENSKATLDGKQLLAIKGIIESKDSGLGNEISNEGTPQLSPEHCSRKSKVLNEKAELGLQESPENKEPCYNGCVSSGDHSTFSNPSEKGEKTKSEKEEGKKNSQRVDLCIQVDLPENVLESDSDVEYSSAGVQTSPWLESGELSPLCCGQFTISLNESTVNPYEASNTHEKELSVEGGGHHAPDTGDCLPQGQKGSLTEEHVGTNQENTTQNMKTSECPKLEMGNVLNESCGDIAPSHPKTDSTDNSLSVKEPDFFDGFISEKRRLSRIEEVTESTISHQSDEDGRKNSCESQLDSSSQATSTSSSSRPGSSLVQLGTDASRLGDDPPDMNSVKRAQSHSRKIMKQLYKEMLERNLAGDLSNEKDLQHLRTSHQGERCSTKLSVDETLLQAAQKLEMCARDHELGNSEERVVGDDKSLIDVEGKEEESSIPSQEIAPLNVPASCLEDSLQPHSKSISCSPKDQSGSQLSRRFFSSQSFSSFASVFKEFEESHTDTDSNSEGAANDFDGDSFFSVPVDLDVFEEEPDVNFSLTGSDMNMMSGDEVHHSHNPQMTSRIAKIPDEFSLEELDEEYLEERSSRGLLKHFHYDRSGDHHNSLRSAISSVESGAFFSETINDEQSFGKEVYTQTLEINVSGPFSDGAHFLSHQSISLSRKDHEKGLSELLPKSQEKQSSMIKVPFNYSSKYYFSVEDYSKCPDEDSENLVDPYDQLSRRRQSLINAHLAARGHVFDEIIDETSQCEMEIGRSIDVPWTTDSREEKDHRHGVRDTLNTMASFGEDNDTVMNGTEEFIKVGKRNGRMEKVAAYSRQGADKMSGDSDVSCGSSIISSKVDQYVDMMLENAVEEVRSEEFLRGGADWLPNSEPEDGEHKGDEPSPKIHLKFIGNHHNQFRWGQMENIKKPHHDPHSGGQTKKSVHEDFNYQNHISPSNQGVKVGNGLRDKSLNAVSTENTSKSVERDRIRQVMPDTATYFNSDLFTLHEQKGHKKISSGRITINGLHAQNLSKSMVVDKDSDERWTMSRNEILDLSHNSYADGTDEKDGNENCAVNLSHSVCYPNGKKVDCEYDYNRVNLSVGLTELNRLNNGLYHEEPKGNLEINEVGDAFNSGEKTLTALTKSPELMPSYEELYSKAENLISNLDALITGNK